MANSATSSQQSPHALLSKLWERGVYQSRGRLKAYGPAQVWLFNLVRIHEDLQADGHDDPSLRTVSNNESAGHLGEYNQWDDDEMLDGTREGDHQSSSIEYFPGAAKMYSGGSTFLEKFDMDEFNSCRSSNIYYPFASRGDWQLASWLLRSGLSMRAMDAFFRLTWYAFYCFNSSISTYSHRYHIRSKLYLSPSVRQMSSVNVPSCYPADHAGSPKRFAHHIQPSGLLYSTGAIRSNSSNVSSIAPNFGM